MGLSTSQKNGLLNAAFGAAAYTAVDPMYVALFVGGTEVSTSGTAYARQSVANNNTNWPGAVNGVAANGVAVTYAQATADWGVVDGFRLMTAVTAGVEIARGTIASPRDIRSGDTAKFLIGSLTITFADS